MKTCKILIKKFNLGGSNLKTSIIYGNFYKMNKRFLYNKKEDIEEFGNFRVD